MTRTRFNRKNSNKLTRNKTGPKSKLEQNTKKVLEIAQYHTSKGKGQRYIAKKLGVSLGTVEGWMRNKPEFRKAVEKGWKEANENVKTAFYESAIGYSHPDTVIMTNRVTEYDDNGKPIKSYNEPLIVPTTKHYPPNALSCLKWLTIKDRENWMDVQKLESNLNINITQNVDLTDFSDEELSALEKYGIKQLADDAGRNPN